MARRGLTKKAIDAASYRGNGSSWDIRYDGTVPGFGLRVNPGGTKTFVLRYRTAAGRTRILTLGRYGVLTLDQARIRARKKLVEVLDGADPVAVRRQKPGQTVAELAETYLERHAKQRKKTWKDDARRLDKYIKPAIGTLALTEVRRADVGKLHSKIGRTAPVEANRVLALVSVMFALAERWGFLPEGTPNPAHGIDTFKEKSRDRYVTPAEMPRLAAAIGEEPSLYVRAALWLYLLTGLRKTELLAARWTDLDLDRKELRIEETKAGRPHVVPLSAPAVTILTALPRHRSNPYVFPGPHRGKPLKGFYKNWKAIRERAGLEDVHLHDLRRTVGSWLAASGASLPLIGKVLNHSNASTTQIYARLAESAARNALEDYGKDLLAVAGVEPNVRPAEAE